MSTQHPVLKTLAETVALVGAWLGSITLADVQAMLGIVSGFLVIGYTASQWYVLWRDKVRRRGRK